MVKIPREHYDTLLSGIPKGSPAYRIMMAGVIYRQKEKLHPTDTIMLVCEDSEAMILLVAAYEVCLAAAVAVEEAIRRPEMP
jgi:hypothetical protein